ncbi:histidinol dehydrogenase [Prochlorococcus marinus]|uniref:Histidinol dehydrogenase n=1 Tax=Prochlorococcus marinus (strain MIT 9211) TaxID=93059 RepID=A9BCH9_PROM4|nr:histidinol dehydrogenase [Prochlorococcus marinus]ABX09541.1 Histidinol dehydrogenase [Prochlorococcus marinus str. MIT 9211]
MTALERISNRTCGDGQKKAVLTVEKILERVKKDGDTALIEYTKKFDGFDPDPLEVPLEAIERAWEETPKPLQDALITAKHRIQDFHQKQIPKNILFKGIEGETLGRRWQPVQKAGIYIPGGRASYPSTVLMNAIPASVAGVKEIIMVSPGGSNGLVNQTVLAAAYITGIKTVFRIGGAQAIGAMAYGTNTIPKVNVISGPGNLYVTLAKKYVYGDVGIDALAGPSEVLIIADNSADVRHIAADLLAQAEHDPLAATILLTTNSVLAEKIDDEIMEQLEEHPRKEICLKALKDWGLIVICNDLETCAKLTDYFAPEHLELLLKMPYQVADKINNAGAIFIGAWSPEATGDYLAGPNHTLPTSGTARFSGALGVETFMKNTSIIEFNKQAFDKNSKAIIELANSEGLHSHAKSIEIRLSKSSEEI